MSRVARAAVPAEVVAVWTLLALVAVEVLVTYSRLPADELYHVSGSGIEGGASRVLVFLNWPVALVAIPVLLLLVERLGAGGRIVAVAGIGLSAAVFWPRVVRQSNLDARWANVPAAAGVAIAVALTLLAWPRVRPLVWAPFSRADRVRVAVAVVVVAVAIPWIAADLGFYLDDVPGLRWLFETGALRVEPGRTGAHPAVHHGQHHGMVGALLVLVALLLSRVLPTIGRHGIRSLVAAYLALTFTYGIGNIANDAWLEQIVKRGWTNWRIPSVTEPRLSVAWAIVVAAAAAIWALWEWRSRARDRQGPDLSHHGSPQTTASSGGGRQVTS